MKKKMFLNREVIVIGKCEAWWNDVPSSNCIWADKPYGLLFVVKDKHLKEIPKQHSINKGS